MDTRIYQRGLGHVRGVAGATLEGLRENRISTMEGLLKIERNLVSLNGLLGRLEALPISAEEAEIRVLCRRLHELVRSFLALIDRAKRATAAC